MMTRNASALHDGHVLYGLAFWWIFLIDSNLKRHTMTALWL